MKLASALVGLAALGGVALTSAAASAAPVEVPVTATGMVVPAGYVCNEWGHCWHRHYYGGRYYHRHYWPGDSWHHWHRYGWHRYNRWHHPWAGGYGWHHWHQW